MKYAAFPITKRIEHLKKAYLGLTVPQMTDPYHPTKYQCYGTGDRLMTLGYLRGYEKHFDEKTAMLRASYAEAEELSESKPVILDDELLLGHLYLPEYTEQEQKEYDRLCEAFRMSAHTFLHRPPRKDHICLDLEKLLRVGIRGLCAEIEEKQAAIDYSENNAYPSLEAVRAWEFYECSLIELRAVSDLAARYAKEALRLAEQSAEPRKSELLRLGNMLMRVPDEPARGFYEALQSVQFFLSTLFGLYPLGRPDRYLYPYYKKDIESGKLDRAFAQELIDNFCLCISDRVFTRAACGFIVGGTDENGDVIENDLTYMFLTSLAHLGLPDPNGALAVSRKTSDDILLYSAQILSRGTTHPAFYNDETIIDSLIKNYGVSPADAVSYIHSTCAEISVAGKSKAHTTSFSVNLPRELLELVAEGGFDSFDGLYEAYILRLRERVKASAKRYAIGMLEGARIGNGPMRICALVDDCIARGKSIYEGGERYMFEQPILVGFSTVVDSLIAIRALVFEQKSLSLDAFFKIVSEDFEGSEPLRQAIIKKLPHYGNDDPRADKMAAMLAASLKSLFGGCAVGDHMMPGTFSYINHATMGARLGATFDGRRAGAAYSDGCGPVQGRDTSGPTAMILSLTSWDQSPLLGGMVVNMKFGKDTLVGRRAESFVALVRAFMERGGIELQVNAVDKATLEDARRNPSAHEGLIVRIGGYSDYFTRLSPALQQEIIDRTEY